MGGLSNKEKRIIAGLLGTRKANRGESGSGTRAAMDLLGGKGARESFDQAHIAESVRIGTARKKSRNGGKSLFETIAELDTKQADPFKSIISDIDDKLKEDKLTTAHCDEAIKSIKLLRKNRKIMGLLEAVYMGGGGLLAFSALFGSVYFAFREGDGSLVLLGAILFVVILFVVFVVHSITRAVLDIRDTNKPSDIDCDLAIEEIIQTKSLLKPRFTSASQTASETYKISSTSRKVEVTGKHGTSPEVKASFRENLQKSFPKLYAFAKKSRFGLVYLYLVLSTVIFLCSILLIKGSRPIFGNVSDITLMLNFIGAMVFLCGLLVAVAAVIEFITELTKLIKSRLARGDTG